MGNKSALSTEIVWQILLEYGEKCGKYAPKILLDGENMVNFVGNLTENMVNFVVNLAENMVNFVGNLATRCCL